MKLQRFYREYLYLLFASLFSVAIVLPILIIGIPDTVDLPQHFRFAETFYSAIISGDPFPGWAGSENFGYGDIGIRFYPPLAYYFLAFARIITGNWYDATTLSFMFWMLAGSIGIYCWSRNWLSIKDSAIVSFIYTLVPFHLSQLYTGFNQFSEVAASSILTICFACLTKVINRGKLTDIVAFGSFYALLILAHLPTSIVGSVCLGIYTLTLLRKDSIIKPLAKAAAAVMFGLTASSFYWIRLITEMKWLNHEAERYSQGFFDYSQNFFPLSYYIVDKPVYIYFIWDLTVSLTMLLFVFAIPYAVYQRKKLSENQPSKTILTTVLPVGLFAFFMFTPLSKPIWQILTPLQKIQFPVRWMPVAAMCGSLVFAAAFLYLKKSGFLKQKPAFYAVFSFFTIVVLFNFTYVLHPSSYMPLNREKFESKIRNLPNETSFFCWWTVWSKMEALETELRIQAGNRKGSVITWINERKTIEIEAGTHTNARIATFYYPHWKAIVNGLSVPVEKDENGAILVTVPSEKSIVVLYFEEPRSMNIAGIVSFLTWLFTALFLTFNNLRLRTGIRLQQF